jgi:hypothetical protein
MGSIWFLNSSKAAGHDKMGSIVPKQDAMYDERLVEPFLNMRPASLEDAKRKMLFGLSKYQSLYETRILVERFPQCFETKHGTTGQTPLHVAASKGVSCDVIILMMNIFPAACAVADDQGRLPLHYAAMPSKWIIPAECGYFLDERDERSTLDPQYLPMLCQMCLVYSEAAAQEDCAGTNPIEHALLDSASDTMVVQTLRRASAAHWKDKIRSQAVAANTPIPRDDLHSVACRSA